MGKLAILAGSGDLPLIAAREAIQAGQEVIILGVKESDFTPQEFSNITIPIHITKLGQVIKLCKKNNVDRLLLLGKINKNIVLKSWNYDLKAITVLAKMLNKNDYTFFAVISKEFEKEKITIISQKTYLQSLLLPEGKYTKIKIPSSILKDMEYGMELAGKLAELDIGQTVITSNQMALALEAIEGTNETIKRGGSLSRGKGATVCKNAKVSQDDRFDLPTIGIETIESMHESGCTAIAIKSGNTIVVNPLQVIKKCESLKIHLVSLNNSSSAKTINEKYIKL